MSKSLSIACFHVPLSEAPGPSPALPLQMGAASSSRALVESMELSILKDNIPVNFDSCLDEWHTLHC